MAEKRNLKKKFFTFLKAELAHFEQFYPPLPQKKNPDFKTAGDVLHLQHLIKMLCLPRLFCVI